MTRGSPGDGGAARHGCIHLSQIEVWEVNTKWKWLSPPPCFSAPTFNEIFKPQLKGSRWVHYYLLRLTSIITALAPNRALQLNVERNEPKTTLFLQTQNFILNPTTPLQKVRGCPEKKKKKKSSNFCLLQSLLTLRSREFSFYLFTPIILPGDIQIHTNSSFFAGNV